MAYLTDLATKIKTWANNKFQPLLVSGTNIKTINSNSLVGSGNIVVGGENVNIQTLNSTKSLVASDAPIQVFTTYNNVTVNLPTTGLIAGQKFEIWNISQDSYSNGIYVKVNGDLVVTISSSNKRTIIWDGQHWKCELSSSVSLGDCHNYLTGIGIGKNANGNNSVGIGIGYNAFGNSDNGIGLGRSASENYNDGIGIGYGASNNYSFGIGIGGNSTYNHSGGIGIGYTTSYNQYYGISIGHNSSSGGYGNIALGQSTQILIGVNKISSSALNGPTNLSRFTIQKFQRMDFASESASWQFFNPSGVFAENDGILIPARTVIQFRLQINAIDMTDYNVKCWVLEGAIKRNNSDNTNMVGSVNKTVIGQDIGTSNWDVQAIANDDWEQLSIQIKHDCANTVRFTGNAICSETYIDW